MNSKASDVFEVRVLTDGVSEESTSVARLVAASVRAFAAILTNGLVSEEATWVKVEIAYKSGPALATFDDWEGDLEKAKEFAQTVEEQAAESTVEEFLRRWSD